MPKTLIATLTLALSYSPLNWAGSYLGSGLIADGVTYPIRYSGLGGQINVKVCVVPGTPNASEMLGSVLNSIQVLNKLQSTSSNIRSVTLPSNIFDFESVSLHELGHCIGLGHPNLGFGAGEGNENYTQSNRGADGLFSFDPGLDGIVGSADDVRNDDVNTHYFNASNNNPFSENATIDASTYTNNIALLPTGDLFPSGADRTVSATPRYRAPFTEASMQQGVFPSEIQRTLTHDDVSTLRYAMSGLDRTQGTDDDYSVNLFSGGVSNDADCDITIAMDAAQTGFAVCNVAPLFVNENIHIASASIFFNPEIDWYFNNTPPCSETTQLEPGKWQMISLPCQVGISTSASLADVLGDDLGLAGYGTDWVVFGHNYVLQTDGDYSSSYQKLALDDTLENGKGYWIISSHSGPINVEGEYNSRIDTQLFLDSANANSYGWNLVGMPFRFQTAWADTHVVDNNGDVLTLDVADPIQGTGPIIGASGTACTNAPAPDPACKMARFAFRYNSAIGDYDLLDTSAGVLNAFDAAWVFVAKPGLGIRFPMPIAERTTL